MTTRPVQRWRVTDPAEPQQHRTSSPPSSADSTMCDTAPKAGSAVDASPLLPPSNPLSPAPFAIPPSPCLPSLPLCRPSPPPPPDYPLTPLLRRACTALRLLSHPTRPFVTLTFAQSLDASLSYSPAPGTPPLLLSSPASLRLTHYLRAVHSAILIGANTLLCDNPSLTCRLVPNATSPTPIILEGDTAIATTTTAYKAIRPDTWIVMNERGVRADRVGRLWTRQTWEGGGGNTSTDTGAEGETDKERRISSLLDRGCNVLVLPCASSSSSHISCSLLLSHLQPYFHSVMVEGGAGVITSLLHCDELVVDQVVLTVAPMFVGGWRSVTQRIGETGMRLCEMSCEMCGDDVILHAFTTPPPSTLLSAITSSSSSASASVSAALSCLSSFFQRSSDYLRRQLAPVASHMMQPYNALVCSSIVLPPLVVMCHTLLRLHAIRRLLPTGALQRLDGWTRWRVGLLLPALLLLAQYLMQHWSTNYSWSYETDKRLVRTRQTVSTHEQELRTFSSSSHPIAPTLAIPTLAIPPLSTVTTPLLPPAQPYLLAFTSSSSTATRPLAPSPLPHLFSPSTSVFAQPASKASAVLEAIKHNRRQSQNGSASSGGGKRRQQQSNSARDDGSETTDAAAIEGEAKTRD